MRFNLKGWAMRSIFHNSAVKLCCLSLWLLVIICFSCWAQEEESGSQYLCVSGVVYDVDYPLAMVNGKVWEKGETILGAKIVEIKESAVEFEYEGRRFVKKVGQDCLKIVSPSSDTIYLGEKKNIKERLDKNLKNLFAKNPDARKKFEQIQKQVSKNLASSETLARIKAELLPVLGIVLAMFFILYVYFCLVLQIIAKKTQTPGGWLAWVPIVQLYLMCKIARRPGWWFWLILISCFIPFVGPIIVLILSAVIWMDIARARGKPSWMGVLIALIPGLNLILMGYLAFSGSPDQPPESPQKETNTDIDIGSPSTYRG